MDENLRDDAEVIISDEEENTQESSTSGDEETTDLASELEKKNKILSQVLARAKRAEEEVKKFKSLNETKAQPKINNTLSREEAILIAEGMKVEDLDQLQVIAKGKGIGLLEAKSDPLFASYYESVTKQRKSEAAKLGASKGSGQVQSKPNISAPGLSEEEHKRLWKELTNQ